LQNLKKRVFTETGILGKISECASKTRFYRQYADQADSGPPQKHENPEIAILAILAKTVAGLGFLIQTWPELSIFIQPGGAKVPVCGQDCQNLVSDPRRAASAGGQSKSRNPEILELTHFAILTKILGPDPKIWLPAWPKPVLRP